MLIQTHNLHKSYQMGPARLHVLRGIDLGVEAGEFVAVVGASGSGKSTLLHLLGLLDTPDEGQVLLDGTDIYRLPARRRSKLRNQTFGFVFQFYHLLPELNLLENVLLPRMVAVSAGGWIRGKRRAKQCTRELLDEFGLADRTRHRPAELSGGERQRAAIARALVNQPKILLADEPTGNLDSATGADILNVLERLNRAHGQTIVMVTHDPNVAARAHRTMHLTDGKFDPAPQ